ncbi:PTS mannose/fructose/sorbose/N-acetylgalactosamine transporter subunit IIC [Neobacillus cucumis]|uniref:PTS mannose/fructose/sorbose/N-acetylgalactosamine transporter subunit IIC n=1 Tax=Neobacillus cucumis TaxID=1740721 RepID=UPI002852F705|nr:PTS sugar transporter subunit IIC [Neobacillus cucumis]MDR4949432.1 PTS sugar transporter subunit IIC [Neobacillus cucumis]
MEIIQGLLIIALAFWMVLDQQGFVLTTWFPSIIGMIAGFIMGDVPTAMVIAGTFQLMALGVANIGGSSVPNYGLAALVGIYIAIRTTNDVEHAKAVALAVGVPVGMLGIQLDVLGKILNSYVSHAAQKALNEGKFKKMERIFWIGPLIFGLTTALPTALCVLFGDKIVKVILDVVPKWFTDGLSIAGSMLPVVGIALLLQFMPVKKYITMLLIGFVVSAYLNLPILGIAILGFAFAYYFFTQNMNKIHAATAVVGVETLGEGDDFDE